MKKTFYGVDTLADIEPGDDEEVRNMPEQFLNSLTPNSLPPQALNLKKGAIVMLIRNICQQLDLCNGTRLKIVSMSNNMLTCQILNSTQMVFLPRMLLTSSKDAGYNFKINRFQFPIRLAYSMTINKGQGKLFFV